MLDRDLTVEITDPAKDRLIEIGFDPSLGARPLRRAVQREVEDRLSEKILAGELNAGDHVVVGFESGEFTFGIAARGEKVGSIAGGGSHVAGSATPDLAITSD